METDRALHPAPAACSRRGYISRAVRVCTQVTGIYLRSSRGSTGTRHQRKTERDGVPMRIEDVKKPTVTLAEACEILRCEGYGISRDRLKAGIYGGVYPFGEVVDRTEGLTKNDVYTVYTAFLRKWIEERRVS